MSSISMIFCGDVLPAVSTQNPDPLECVRGRIAAADIGFVNFEGCIRDGSEQAYGQPANGQKKKNVLWTSARDARYLKELGFNVVNLANNHAFDLGLPGCIATIHELDRQGLAVVGLRNGSGGQAVMLDCKGTRIGFLGYADYGFPSTLMNLRERVVLSDIRRLRRSVDFLVISLHWGYEYVRSPSPRQRKLARAFVEAGAGLIVGQHPHISQGIERYRGAIISYSLGNFFFPVDEMPVPVSRAGRDGQYGFLLAVRVGQLGIESYETLPVSAFRSDRVTILNGSGRARSLERLGRLSSDLDRHTPGYLAWLWDASSTFALLFRSAWAWRLRRFGARELLAMAREIANEPILLPMLLISYLRFPVARTGGQR